MVERALEQYMTEPNGSVLTTVLAESMRYSLLGGGKRIRPVLTLAFAEACGGTAENALPFACAVEMVHVYSLIHDDLPCMDDDKIRRGKPCNHIAYGEDTALLAGDALLTLAFEVIAGNDLVSAQQRTDAVLLLAACSGRNGMVGGQVIDLQSEGKEVELAVLEQMNLGKTVALISAACRLGCIAAGKPELALDADTYARGLGMAFQIRDDILGAVGDEKILGKTVGIDDKNQKRNYVSLLGLDRAQELVAAYTKEAIGALGVFPEDTRFIRELSAELIERTS